MELYKPKVFIDRGGFLHVIELDRIFGGPVWTERTNEKVLGVWPNRRMSPNKPFRLTGLKCLGDL
jgi:hypothetical protein